MRGHTHDRAIAVTHEHIVAHPYRHLRLRERVRHKQACRHTLFVLGGQLSLSGAAALAFFNKCSQILVGLGCMQGQGVLGGHGAKRHAHDGVCTGGEDIQLALAYGLPACALNVVGKGKTHALALTDPVFLHQLDALGPSGHLARGHKVQQLLGVSGDLEVVARNFAFFDQGTSAPATPVDHLLIGQHGLVYWVPIDNLGFAVGNALLQHF